MLLLVHHIGYFVNIDLNFVGFLIVVLVSDF